MPNPAFLPPLPLPPTCKHLPPTHRPPHATLQLPRTAKPPPVPPIPRPHPPHTRHLDPFQTAAPRRTTPPKQPILILPGYGASHVDYEPLATLLRATLGPDAIVAVAPVEARTWLSTLGGRPVTPVLRVIDRAVRELVKECGGGGRISLVAHSAAGWIARIYLGEVEYPMEGGVVWGGKRWVESLVCLGTPHRSAEGVTRRNMEFVNGWYPGGFEKEVRYVNFMGDGCAFGKERGGERFMFWKRGWFARISYALTDEMARGGAVEGDGVVPVAVGLLQGAQVNVVLKGVWHSPDSEGPWYGHRQVVEHWSAFLK